MRLVGEDRPGHERGFGRQRSLHRANGLLDRPQRARLGHLAIFRSRRVLPLGQSINLVVEQQDLEVLVSAQGVDEMVAPDGQAVAVAGDDPDLLVRVGRLHSGGHGQGAAVNGMETVGGHVERKPAAATDSAYKGVLAGRLAAPANTFCTAAKMA